LHFPFNTNTSIAEAIAGDSDVSDVVAGDASYVSSSSLELYDTISSVVVSRNTRLSLVVKHIELFLWTTNLEAVSALPLCYSCAFIP